MSTPTPKFKDPIFRKDWPQIVLRRRELASIVGVEVAYNASGYAAGTVLAKNSVSSKFQGYDDNASSGLNTAVCVLAHDIDVTDFASSVATVEARAYFGGELDYGKLVGIDAAGVVDLKGRTLVLESGKTLLKF
jgi:hypothetical protein